MFKKLLIVIATIFVLQEAHATGEPSTYFQIYVPPNGDAVQRDVALIITAIYDSTSFDIIDDGADGDTDDSKSGMLMAGQSYVLYIKDNGINDDARYASGGVLKWDGDYFIIKSNKLIFASQSTNSDWQHDWVPSTDKKSIGQKYIIYSPSYTSSKRDVNVFAYQNNTTVTFKKISWQPKKNTGYTDVNIDNATTIFTRTLNIGEDIIYKYPDGRDVMEAGETYMIVSDKPITVQYGALFGNERDGGGYVPTSNGSSSGELMYFSVPYQSGGEQEIRIVSWDDANAVKLERYSNGSWISMKDFSLNKMKAGDWVGKTNGNVSYATVFRITCTPGKRVSVFEGNWFETGSPGTSDMATMVSSENGTCSGVKFLTYMAPPGNEANAVNPFTGKAFGQQLTHLYLFAKEGAFVTIKDANTNGTKISKTYTIGAERYADCFLTLAEWQSIQPTGPYLTVESSSPISVMNSNFNDNWMCYTGSSMMQAFTQTGAVSQSNAVPTDTVKVTTYINIGSTVTNADLHVVVQDGLKVVDSKFTGASTPTIDGTITQQPTRTVVDFSNIPNLDATKQYKVETNVVASLGSNAGNVLTNQTNTTVETIVTGYIGSQLQQSSTTQVVNVNPNNTSKLIFSKFADNVVTKDSTDSWTASFVDVNKDGYDDIFATDKRSNKPNLLYINNKQGGFTKANVPAFLQDSAITVSSTWADIDNDGDIDLLVVNNTRKSNTLYRNNGDGSFVKDNAPAFVKDVSYYHGAAFADYDNDGKVDVFLCNFFPTKYNELYRNNGSGTYVKELTNVIPVEANQSIGPSWADYDGDGFLDLFVPNGKGQKNSLFHNEGNGTFSKVSNVITNDGGQSVGSCWGDYDNDGDLDLFVTNSNAQGNFLYRNNGNGNFTKITTGDVVTDKGTSHGCSFADIDNDGDLDLFVTTDKNIKFLYINNGDGTFTKKTDEVVTFDFGNAFGHAWSDFDHDGDLDLLVATHSGEPNAIFTNNGNSNSWIEINLTGTVSNKSAIGADVFVKTNGIWQMREVNAQSGFGGQSSLTQHFGLKNTSTIDSIKIKWPSGIVQILTNVTAKQILNIVETQAVKVNGGVFFDANNNCIKDAGEQTVSRALINIIESNTKLYANNDGVFSTNLTNGTYQLQVATAKGLTSNCTATTITIANNTNTVDTTWIPATVICNNADAEVMMGSTAIRKGFTNNQFNWVVTNSGRTTASSVTAKLKIPATIIPATPSTAFSNIETLVENGITKKVYSWTVNNLAPFQSQLLSFNHGNSSTVNIGDSITFNTWLEGVTNDCNVANNSLTQNYVVVGAIDPNDLAVSPIGYGKEGYILPTQTLTYTIRFQNIGNHPASSILIKDVLPEGLDIRTLKIVSQSHEGLSIESNNHEVNFKFNEIYLSDSLTDNEASKGFITFSIAPNVDVRANTQLVNKVSIQFDGYAAVETNETLNTIQSKQQEEEMIVVKTYPNPTSDVVMFSLQHKMGKFTEKEIKYAEITDMFGRVLIKKSFAKNDELRINLPEILQGFYLLKITDSEHKTYSQKILVQKNKL